MEIEDLEKRVKVLESKQSGNMNMFGRSYSLVGSSSSDLVLKTRGLVKILYGNKFIDLIKDGKINVNSDFIFVEDEVGTKDGIYIVKDKVYVVASGNPIELTIGGNSYVSYIGNLETTSEQKELALLNIGILYSTLEEARLYAPNNGIVYIKSEGKLYFVKEGLFTEFKVELPKQFEFTGDNGNLIIDGNGIKFDKLTINNKGLISNSDLFIESPDVSFNGIVTVSNTLKANTFSSIANPDLPGGFKIYVNDSGQSVIVIDKIEERTKTLSGPVIWYATTDTITDLEENIVTFNSTNVYKVGDTFFYEELSYDDEEQKTIFTYGKTSILEVKPGGKYKIDAKAILTGFKLYVSTDDFAPIRIKDGNIEILLKGESTLKIGKLDNGKFGIKSNYAEFGNIPPRNSIILYNGTTAPDGWKLCDGTDDTPNIPSDILGMSYIIKV